MSLLRSPFPPPPPSSTFRASSPTKPQVCSLCSLHFFLLSLIRSNARSLQVRSKGGWKCTCTKSAVDSTSVSWSELHTSWSTSPASSMSSVLMWSVPPPSDVIWSHAANGLSLRPTFLGDARMTWIHSGLLSRSERKACSKSEVPESSSCERTQLSAVNY